jgi:AcrR family transcriptional regulator
MPRVVDHKERRLAFAEAAFRVIAKRGLARVTVREIAREAGFTTGALVHYFKSKDQVLIQASEYGGIMVRARMEQHEATRSGIDALKRVLYESLPMTPEMRGTWNVWLGFWDRATHNAEVRAITEVRYREWTGRIAELVKNAQKAGELSPRVDPMRAAQSIVSLIDGIGVRVLLTRSDMSARRQKELVDALIDNLPHSTKVRRNPSRAAARADGAARTRGGRGRLSPNA